MFLIVNRRTGGVVSTAVNRREAQDYLWQQGDAAIDLKITEMKI